MCFPSNLEYVRNQFRDGAAVIFRRRRRLTFFPRYNAILGSTLLLAKIPLILEMDRFSWLCIGWQHILLTLSLVISWYLLSISLSVFNKWMYSDRYFGFQFPIFVTSIQMLVQSLCAHILLSFILPLRGLNRISSREANVGNIENESNTAMSNSEFVELHVPLTADSLWPQARNSDLSIPSDIAKSKTDTIKFQNTSSDASHLSDDDDNDKENRLLVPSTSYCQQQSNIWNECDDEDRLDCPNHSNRPSSSKSRRSQQEGITTLIIYSCAVASGLDISLSALSLEFITLSFYTMIKSSNLVFVLLFAFLLGLEIVQPALIGIIFVITAGVIMMVATETSFHLLGFIIVMIGSIMGGLRWSLTQLLLSRKATEFSSPFRALRTLTFKMFVFIFPLACLVEGPLRFLKDPFWAGNGLLSFVLILLPGLVAFLMTCSEFFLIRHTSATTLGVAGIFKELCTISVSAALFKDRLTALNLVGLCIALAGILLYNALRYRALRKHQLEELDAEQDVGIHEELESIDQADHRRCKSVDGRSSLASRKSTILSQFSIVLPDTSPDIVQFAVPERSLR